MASMRLAAVSIDLDEIPNYFAIHGLPAPPAALASLVYDRALDRARAWARALSIPLTLFVIARDLASPRAVGGLRRCVDDGDEIANHSLDHRYDLTSLAIDEMRTQVLAARESISRALGVSPLGFRSPGYTTSDALLSIVEQTGHLYDASVFPCPTYFLAKQAVLGMMTLTDRRSDSVSGEARHLFAPTQPYRLGKPYWEKGRGMIEIPIQVTRGPRLPFIGTSLTLAPAPLVSALTGLVDGLPTVNLELHGIDFLDVSDGLDPLRRVQPDVVVQAEKKRERLSNVVRRLQRSGYRFVRYDELAKQVH